MTRQMKSPEQRAKEALGIADRKVTRLRADTKRLMVELDTAQHALHDAEQLRAYAAAHPALQKTTTSNTDQKEHQA